LGDQQLPGDIAGDPLDQVVGVAVSEQLVAAVTDVDGVVDQDIEVTAELGDSSIDCGGQVVQLEQIERDRYGANAVRRDLGCGGGQRTRQCRPRSPFGQ
jgi:hypothetical protein